MGKEEKIALIFLSVMLLAGTSLLYFRQNHSRHEVIVERSGQREEVRLDKIYEELAEKRRIDINTACAEDLDLVPGVGPKLAEKITSYREENGSLSDDSELLKVKGIGPKKLEKMKPYIKTDRL
jgi:comEA protein